VATQDHEYSSIYIYEGGTKKFSYDFSTQLGAGETVTSCLASAYNDDGGDVSASIVTATSISNPSAYVTVGNGIADRTYEVKIRATTSAAQVLTAFVAIEYYGSVSLNPKMGVVDANSYVNLKEANSYVKSVYGHSSSWDNLTFEGKKRVLIQAADDLEILNYKGKQYYNSQRMAFPRNNHDTLSGTASINTATSGTLRGLNLYSAGYNEMPNKFFQYGTVHITAGNNHTQTRYISSSVASKAGMYGEVGLASPFTSNVVASDNYLLFVPMYREVKSAQCEQALFIADNIYYGYADYTYAGIGYVRTGDLGLSFKNPDSTTPGKKLSLKATKLLGRHTRKTMRYGRA
jgi:hypothetical protein